MESLGMLVADQLIEIDLVDKTLGSFVTGAWQKYKIIFEEIRIKHSDPFLGEYFQWLAEYINEDRKKIHANHFMKRMGLPTSTMQLNLNT